MSRVLGVVRAMYTWLAGARKQAKTCRREEDMAGAVRNARTGALTDSDAAITHASHQTRSDALRHAVTLFRLSRFPVLGRWLVAMYVAVLQGIAIQSNVHIHTMSLVHAVQIKRARNNRMKFPVTKQDIQSNRRIDLLHRPTATTTMSFRGTKRIPSQRRLRTPKATTALSQPRCPASCSSRPRQSTFPSGR